LTVVVNNKTFIVTISGYATLTIAYISHPMITAVVTPNATLTNSATVDVNGATECIGIQLVKLIIYPWITFFKLRQGIFKISGNVLKSFTAGTIFIEIGKVIR